MLNFGDNTGEKDELDPVLDDEETLQDSEDEEDFDEEFDDEESGQNDSDDADDEEESDEEDGENNGSEDNAKAPEKADSEGKNPSGEENPTSTKKPLSKEENAANAARRRQEALEAKVKEEHVKTVIDVLGGVNPYTKKEMTDAHDVEVYERMKRIEKAGGDPITDYASTLADERRQAEKARNEPANMDFNSWAKKDAEDFAKANPDVALGKLLTNKTFKTIAEPLLKNRVPMSKIYELFKETQANIDSVKEKTKSEIKAAVSGKIANAQASAGSLKSDGDTQGALYTKEQLERMSPEELDRNWDKVDRSYEALGKKK